MIPHIDTTDFTHIIDDYLALPHSHTPRLFALPGLIDPHVHLRTPGHEYKENWISGSQAAIRGGFTTVLDMPNTSPACSNLNALHEKKSLINQQLSSAGIPLRYGLYLGADRNSIEQIPLCRNEIVGIKVYMGSTTGNLLMDDEVALENAFSTAANCDLVVAVHAEDEGILQSRSKLFFGSTNPMIHSVIRCPEAAEKAVDEAISLAERFGTKLYIAHVSTRAELNLIRQARRDGIHVYAEVTPHHLFLSDEAYEEKGTFVQMNPPLRDRIHVEALWEALADGTIDTIGTDHAPHTIAEKEKGYPLAPSGVPGLETALPLLLDAVNDGLISLEKVIELTSTNPRKIFNLPLSTDFVIVDLNRSGVVNRADLKTKCGWSPFEGWQLTGLPVFTCVNGHLFDSHTVNLITTREALHEPANTSV